MTGTMTEAMRGEYEQYVLALAVQQAASDLNPAMLREMGLADDMAAAARTILAALEQQEAA